MGFSSLEIALNRRKLFAYKKKWFQTSYCQNSHESWRKRININDTKYVWPRILFCVAKDFVPVHFLIFSCQLFFSHSSRTCRMDMRWFHQTFVFSYYHFHWVQFSWLSRWIHYRLHFWNMLCCQDCYVIFQTRSVIFEFNFLFYYIFLCLSPICEHDNRLWDGDCISLVLRL